MAKLDALQGYHFKSQKRQAERARDLGLAQNKQDRSTALLQHNWQKDDLTRQFARARERFGGQWSRRGMMNSGMYGHKLGQFITDRQEQLGRADTGWAQQKAGFNLVDDQLKTIKANTWSELDLQREALLKTKSAMLNAANLY